VKVRRSSWKAPKANGVYRVSFGVNDIATPVTGAADTRLGRRYGAARGDSGQSAALMERPDLVLGR